MRTRASLIAPSPWGWYLPITSPVTRATFIHGPVGARADVVHAPEDPALHRLQAVAHVGQRARGDDGHRVVEEGVLHLLLDLDRLDRAEREGGGEVGGVVGAVVVDGGVVVGHQMSRNLTSLALVWMNCLRDSTSSPMRIDITSSASAACSTLTLEQRAPVGVHRGDAQLVVVHLAEALEAVEVLLVGRAGLEERVLGVVVLQVHLLLADLGGVQRRLAEVDVATVDERAHLPEEEREQQRADVLAVDVGVGHDADLVVAALLDVELLAHAAADGGDERLDRLVLEHLVEAGALDVEDLAADREDRLGERVARGDRGAAGRVALDDEQLALLAVLRASSP